MYVDDFFIIGNDFDGIVKLKYDFYYIFIIKDFGKVRYFLGMEIVRFDEVIFLN